MTTLLADISVILNEPLLEGPNSLYDLGTNLSGAEGDIIVWSMLK